MRVKLVREITYTDIFLTNVSVEALLLLALVHTVSGGQDMLVGDEGSSAHVPVINVTLLFLIIIFNVHIPARIPIHPEKHVPGIFVRQCLLSANDP